MKFNEAMHEQYKSFMADIKVCQQKIDALRFISSVSDGPYGRITGNEDKELINARNVIYKNLYRDLNDAYARMFVFRGMFSDKEEAEINEIATTRYYELYKNVANDMCIDNIPTPHSMGYTREEWKIKLTELQTKTEQNRIIKALEGDLSS